MEKEIRELAQESQCCGSWIYKVEEMARKIKTVLEHSTKWHTLQRVSTLSVWLTRIMLELIVSCKDDRQFEIKEPLILPQKQKSSLFINYIIQTSNYKIIRHWFLPICIFFHNSLYSVSIQGKISWINYLLLYTLSLGFQTTTSLLVFLLLHCLLTLILCWFLLFSSDFVMIKCPKELSSILFYSLCTLTSLVISSSLMTLNSIYKLMTIKFLPPNLLFRNINL